MVKMSFTVTQWQLANPTLPLYRALLAVEIKDGNQPSGGRVIITAPEGESIDINVNATRGTGTGEILFSTPADAVVLMAECNIQGNLLTARQSIALRSKTAKAPDRLSVNTAGAAGKYIFIIGVMDEKNTPVPSVPINIINSVNRVIVATGQTDQNGAFTSSEICFPEREGSFLVIAGGLDPVELKLEGPSKWKKAPPVPEPNPADISQGFLNTIVSAWRRGGQDTKGGTP